MDDIFRADLISKLSSLIVQNHGIPCLLKKINPQVQARWEQRVAVYHTVRNLGLRFDVRSSCTCTHTHARRERRWVVRHRMAGEKATWQGNNKQTRAHTRRAKRCQRRESGTMLYKSRVMHVEAVTPRPTTTDEKRASDHGEQWMRSSHLLFAIERELSIGSLFPSPRSCTHSSPHKGMDHPRV